jgi:hypothetical protein
MSGQTAHYLIICYGSRESDPLGDERYGRDQRRMELDLRLKLPRAGMRPDEVEALASTWLHKNYANIKHRQAAHVFGYSFQYWAAETDI